MTNPETKEFQCEACRHPAKRVAANVQGFEIIACDACGLRFVPPNAMQTVDYDKLYSREGDYSYKLEELAAPPEAGPYVFPRSRRIALDKIQKIKPSNLLEIGCGTGDFLRAAEEMGIKAWGSDVSANALALARQRVKAELFCGILAADTFGGRTFDMVCSWEVLEHVPSPREFMQTIWNRLEPNGFVFLSTPNYESRYMWQNMPQDARSRPPVHVTFWTQNSLKTLLSQAGFEQVSVERYSIPASAAALGNHALDRWLVYPESYLRHSQRMTLLAIGRKPGQST